MINLMILESILHQSKTNTMLSRTTLIILSFFRKVIRIFRILLRKLSLLKLGFRIVWIMLINQYRRVRGSWLISLLRSLRVMIMLIGQFSIQCSIKRIVYSMAQVWNPKNLVWEIKVSSNLKRKHQCITKV